MKKNTGEIHKPVLLREVVQYLQVDNFAHLKIQPRYIDATLGAGGHTIALLKGGSCVLGIDDDSKMLEIARRNIALAYHTVNDKNGDFVSSNGNFRHIDLIAKENSFEKVDGILFDLGVSSYHFDRDDRGFSFLNHDQPLDMRLNTKTLKISASDLLNTLSQTQLTHLFSEVLDNSVSKRLARAIVVSREERKFDKVGDLVEIIKNVRIPNKKISGPTLPFLALRMAVNSEPENLEEALPKAFSLLKRKGRLLVISFHSGEDRVVKRYFNFLEELLCGKIISKQPLRPSESELETNPRSRSALMRVVEKINDCEEVKI